MATLLPNAVSQFLDANGTPVALGSVGFYIPGTLTKKNTWQDSGENTLNTNPIILDAAGEAVIFGSGIYRQIVTDSAGNLIWDQLTSSTDSGGISWGGTSAGTANAQTIAQSDFSAQDGQQIGFIVGADLSNTGALTVVPGSGSPIPVLRDIASGPAALIGGEVIAGNEVTLVYDITRGAFHLVNPTNGLIQGGIISASTIETSTVQTSTILLKQATDPAPTAEGDMQWSTLFNQLKIGDGVGTQRFLAGPAPGAINGCSIANNSTTAIDFAAGIAADSSNALYLINASTLTKILGTAWAVGTNEGGLFSGSVADGTYHCFIIMRPDTGVVDAGFSTSVTASDRPAAYTYYRRVGSIIRSSGSILAFVQDGNNFYWNTSSPPSEYSALGTRAKAALTLTVPMGIRVQAVLQAGYQASGSQVFDQFFYDGVNTNVGVEFAGAPAAIGFSTTRVVQYTNTSAQIQYAVPTSSGGGGSHDDVNTLGWIDPRGQF